MVTGRWEGMERAKEVEKKAGGESIGPGAQQVCEGQEILCEGSLKSKKRICKKKFQEWEKEINWNTKKWIYRQNETKRQKKH